MPGQFPDMARLIFGVFRPGAHRIDIALRREAHVRIIHETPIEFRIGPPRERGNLDRIGMAAVKAEQLVCALFVIGALTVPKEDIAAQLALDPLIFQAVESPGRQQFFENW